MEQQPDAQQVLQRVGEVAQAIRKSEAFPALVGGLVGGAVTALIAVLIASRALASRRAVAEPAVEPAAARAAERPPARTAWLASWTLKDLAQLISVAAPLVKQATEVYKARQK